MSITAQQPGRSRGGD